jgi:hypothetical protein
MFFSSVKIFTSVISVSNAVKLLSMFCAAQNNTILHSLSRLATIKIRLDKAMKAFQGANYFVLIVSIFIS